MPPLCLLKRDGRCDPVIHTRIANGKRRCSRAYGDTNAAPFPWVSGFVERAFALPAGHRIGRPGNTFSPPLAERPSSDDSELIVSADECTVGKPDPAMYEFALRQLNARSPRPPSFDPANVSSSKIPAGIQAALKAGMRVRGRDHLPAQLTEAHLVLPSLEEIQPNDVARRLFHAGA